MFRWTVDPGTGAQTYLESYTDYLYMVIQQVAYAYAPQIEAWMKVNATWTDRTSNARQSLYAEVEEIAARYTVQIIFDHGMSYGYDLEYKYQGQYAIIGPALDYWSVKIFEEVRKLLS